MRVPNHSALICLSTAFLTSAAFIPLAEGQFTFRTVVTSTDLLPNEGAPNGFDSFEYAILSNTITTITQPVVAFVGAADANKGIWGETYVNSPAELTRIVQKGMPFPIAVCSNDVFGNFLYPSMNPLGDVAFVADESNFSFCLSCNGVPVAWEGFFRWSAEDNVLDVMAEILDTSTVDGLPVFFYGNNMTMAVNHNFTPRINQSGYITSYASISGCPNPPSPPVPAAISAHFVGNIPASPIARADTNDSGTLNEAGTMSNPSINNSAAIVYFAELDENSDNLTGSVDPNIVDYTLFFSDSETSVPIFSEGTHAPGARAGINFTELNFHPDINNLGTVVFYAKTGRVNVFANPAVSMGGGIWRGSAGNTASYNAVFLHNDLAPGMHTGLGETFSGFGDAVVNGSDRIAFVGYLDQANPSVDDSNDFGIWADREDFPQIPAFIIVREGSPAPGISSANYTADNGNSPFYDPFINGLGQIAFKAHWQLSTGGAIGEGIWTTAPNGATQLVVSTGQQIDVNGQQKTVASLTFGKNQVSAMGVSAAATSGGEDGRGTSFNDQGEVAFIATFTDGTSGVFVASPASGGSILAPDVDGDGLVTFSDVRMLVSTWGSDDPKSDINHDGVVDSADLALVLKALD